MGKAIVKVRRNSDGTMTIRIGRQVEHFDARDKDKAQIFDHVKFAVYSKGVRMSDVSVAEMINAAQKRK